MSARDGHGLTLRRMAELHMLGVLELDVPDEAVQTKSHVSAIVAVLPPAHHDDVAEARHGVSGGIDAVERGQAPANLLQAPGLDGQSLDQAKPADEPSETLAYDSTKTILETSWKAPCNVSPSGISGELKNETLSPARQPAMQSVHSEDLSIGKVLQSFYVVPSYQREYVWQQEQVELLFNDILDELGGAAFAEAPEYFIGSIVVCPGDEQVYQLIDGQQRMTTIFLSLCAIRDYLADAQLAVPAALALQISAPSIDSAGNDTHRCRLELQYEDSGDFLNQLAMGKRDEAVKHRKPTRSTENLLAAYTTILRFLKQEFGSEVESIRRFYAYLTSKVKLIRIETQDVAKALKVFETINDRGVGLDSMDLLKNLLFMRSDRTTFESLKQRWKQLQDIIFQMKEKPLRFLRYFVVSRYDVLDLREDQLYAWLTKNEAVCGYGKNPLGFAEELLASARAYAHFINGRDEMGQAHPRLQSLQYLSGRLRMHLIILLAGRHLESKQFDRLLREIEDLFFCFLITREHTRTIDNHLSRWAMELRKVRSDADLDAFLNASIARQRRTLAQRFGEEMGRLSADSVAKYRLMYVIARLTQQIEIDAYGENENTKWLGRYTGGGFEIEHVMAQNPSKEAAVEFGDVPTEEFVQTLGNLTLVERSINASLGNRPYSQKRDVYRQSQLLLTRSLAERPKVGQSTKIDFAVAQLPVFDTWTPADVKKRHAFLSSLAFRVWSVPQIA